MEPNEAPAHYLPDLYPSDARGALLVSGPDDWDRVAGKRALAPGVRVRRARALK